MKKTRYAKVNDRLETIVEEIRKHGVNEDIEFDHMEWLMCERQSLILERDNLEEIMTADGCVKYTGEDN